MATNVLNLPKLKGSLTFVTNADLRESLVDQALVIPFP